MGARLTRRRHNSGSAESLKNRHADYTIVKQPDATADFNGNLPANDSDGGEPEKLKVPLADRKVTIEGSQRLLKESRSAVLSELSQVGGELTLNDLSSFSFPFENAVFEGGGVKGIAYIGAVQCLEDAGVKLKRFAGASMGASVAGFLSVGYTAAEIVPLYLQDLGMFIRDSRCELLCFLPRLTSSLGLNPGKKFLNWYGRCLAVKTQDPDITFRQVYERFGTELCVVILNMNTGREQYCHPKTSPDLPVRKAIRMSISVPGVLQPLTLTQGNGRSHMYIDGGVICNYPIYVYDGWWLSMDVKHSLPTALCKVSSEQSSSVLSQLCNPSNRFSDRNDKTIGFKQTANRGFFNDTFHTHEDHERAGPNFCRPDTQLSRRRRKRLTTLERDSHLQCLQRELLLKLLGVFHDCSNSEGYIVKDQLVDCLTKENFAADQMEHLFRKEISIDTLVENIPTIDTDDNLICPHVIDSHLKTFGLDLHGLLETCMVVNEDVKGVTGFWKKLQRHITNAARRSFITPEDLARTVNIHTDYVEFLDFDLNSKDHQFLLQQGYRHTFTFLRNYMMQKKNQPHTKEASQSEGY